MPSTTKPQEPLYADIPVVAEDPGYMEFRDPSSDPARSRDAALANATYISAGPARDGAVSNATYAPISDSSSTL